MKKRYIPLYLLASINVIAVALLLISGYSDHLDPRLFSWISLLGYAFPAILLIVLAFIVVWVFIKKRYLIISVVGLLVAHHPVTLYCPVNSPQDMPDDVIEVLSFNTCYWNMFGIDSDTDNTDSDGNNITAKYLADSNADIIALQETSFKEPNIKLIKDKYEYLDTIIEGTSTHIIIFSRYPTTHKELILSSDNGNFAAAFWTNIKGKEVIIINTYLQCTGLSQTQRQQFNEMIHGYHETDTIRSATRSIFSQILEATKLRSSQAETVASFIRMHSSTPIIVCGDFNDIPHSFVHHTIASGLTDCYQETSRGPGFSFTNYGMRVRIDNMLCSKDITPYNCRIDSDIEVSDHYPIRCFFKISND